MTYHNGHIGQLKLSGLEPLVVTAQTNFINVGERTNVTGSKKFLRLIKEDKYEDALSVALDQVRGGAQILDVNLDEGMIDGKNYGRGLSDAIETQRRFNALDHLMWRQVRLSAGENPDDRIKHIMETKAEFRARVDDLLKELSATTTE